MSNENDMQIARNIFWSGVEFLYIFVTQFFVMRIIIHQLGMQSLGVWSVVMSSVQLTGFLGMGTTSGFGRFLSIAYAKKNTAEIESIFAVIILGAIPLFAASATILYLPLYYSIGFVLSGDGLAEAYSILPLSLVCFITQTLFGCFQSALMSIGAGAQKSQIAIFLCTLQGIISLCVVNSLSLFGLVLAQIISYIISIALSYYFITRLTKVRMIKSFAVNRDIFRRIIIFGLKVQFTSILWTCFEVSLRFVMAHFGGAAAAGIYEIAYKIASQPRILVYTACQNLLPIFISKWHSDRISFEYVYILSYSRVALFSLVSFFVIFMLSPLVSYIMLGEIDTLFLVFSLLTSLAMVCHVLAIASELAAIAAGSLRYNFFGTLTAFVTIVGLGSFLGLQFGSYGVGLAALCSAAAAATFPAVIGARILGLPTFPNLKQALKDSIHFLVKSPLFAINKKRI